MNGLASFPLPPSAGDVTLREQNGEFIAVPKCDFEGLRLNQYPEVDVTAESLKPAATKETARSAFLEHSETQGKRLRQAWYEHGLTGVLEELARTGLGEEPGWLSKAACSVLATVRWTNSFQSSMFPHYAMSSDDIAAEFSQNPRWKEAHVRCFAWHPHVNKFAVSLKDDTIRIYQANRLNLIPLLKHKLQKAVSDLAWRPNSASELAVACQSCILIWNIEPTSLATRPSTSAARVLSSPGHSPVTSLSWQPGGLLLVSGSATSTSMMVWDVAQGTAVSLRRWGGGGVSLVRFSPDGNKLFAACPASTFRIWECYRWSCDTWSKITGRVKTACWSPDSCVLLFATDQPIIYSVTMQKAWRNLASSITTNSRAVEVADVTSSQLTLPDGETQIVGGSIRSMAWSPTGDRLAVQFEGEGKALITVYQTRCKPLLELLPCGFVRGIGGEVPLLISFEPQFKDGALLTVVWSSGRVAHVPMYFTTNQGHPEQHAVDNNVMTSLNGHSFNASLYTSINNS